MGGQVTAIASGEGLHPPYCKGMSSTLRESMPLQDKSCLQACILLPAVLCVKSRQLWQCIGALY